MTFLESLRGMIQAHGRDKTFWIALSGGLDSSVLLALCHEIAIVDTISFRVVHVNHGLSQYANDWQQHCVAAAESIQFPIKIISVKVSPEAGESVEEIAREERYQALSACLKPGDVLLTAHHLDDQAETFLLQLLRGAGVKGLAAMPACKPFGCGYHLRPFLKYTRRDLEAYATSKQLSWIDDDSNVNTRYARNFLRHHVMPGITARWPTANDIIAKSAAHLAEAQSLLDEYAAGLCSQVSDETTDALLVSQLINLSTQQQKLVLRYWIAKAGWPLPDASKLQSILDDVLTAKWDRSPCVTWGEVSLRRHRDSLYLISDCSMHDDTATIQWKLAKPLSIDGVGEFSAEQIIGLPLLPEVDEVQVRFRSGGESLVIPGRGTQVVKNLLQEWGIVPWLRDRVPLIYVNNQLVGIIRPG